MATMAYGRVCPAVISISKLQESTEFAVDFTIF